MVSWDASGMKLVADLHIHSRYSRATSKNLDFVSLAHFAMLKGVQLLGTGDFTHPAWLDEIERQLEPAEPGLFRLRPQFDRKAREGLPAACQTAWVRFVLQVEISNIYKRDGAVRKNHNLVYLPSLEAVRRFNEKLSAIGNLSSDGRPILGLDARDLLEITLETDPLAFLIPAHIWTPWFSMLGSKSGFDSLEACFRDLSPHIFAAETGLSSDPPMNWRVSSLDRLTLVSNSDAHSAAKIAREANLLDIEPSFERLRHALSTRQGFLGTLEFHPEEGKYHLDGHRKCQVRLDPEQTRELGGICPVCGKKLTVGVLSRVLDLADRSPDERPESASPYESLVGLHEVVGEVLGVGPASVRVKRAVSKLQDHLGDELFILRSAPLEDVGRQGGSLLREAVRRVRHGELHIDAGYDGEFGVIRIFDEKERQKLAGQPALFSLSSKSEGKEHEPSHPRELAPNPAGEHVEHGQRKRTSSSRPSRQGHATENLDPWLQGADERQLEAITHGSGPLLVQAGPGSGKTRTLAARVIEHLVRNELRPEQVVALTFSRQAALELTQRVQSMLPSGLGVTAPQARTFHSFGKSIIERATGHPVQIASQQQRESWAEQLLRTTASTFDETWTAGDVLDFVSRSKQARRPNDSANTQEHLALLRGYEQLKRQTGTLDLDDLIVEAVRLLETDDSLRERVSNEAKLVCIDEFQDINDAQARLIELLWPDGANLTAIGDPDQAIYGFRGSQPEHFLSFGDRLPHTKVVHLDTTYRLTRPVAMGASALLGHHEPLRSLKDGPPIELISARSPGGEAEQVVVRIEQLLGGTSSYAINTGRSSGEAEGSIGLGDIAVLVRLRAQRPAVVEALARSGIPCRLIGEDEPHDPRAQKVSVMTMHASKGRQFEVVFVMGLERGLMPLSMESFDTDEGEEKRLLYVAMTRAREHLVLSHAKHRSVFGKRLAGQRSPFLDLLPADVTRKADTARKSRKKNDGQLSLF